MLFLYGQQANGDVDSLAGDGGEDLWIWDNSYYADTYYSLPNVVGSIPDQSQIQSLIFNSDIGAEWADVWSGNAENGSVFSGVFPEPFSIFSEVLSESAASSDGLTASLSFETVLAEAAAAADGIAAAVGFTAALSESAGATDGVAVAVTFGAVLAEPVAAGDGLANGSLFTGTLPEVGVASDSYVGGLAFNGFYVESVAASALFDAAFIPRPPVVDTTGWTETLVKTGIWNAATPVRGEWRTGSYGSSVWFSNRNKK